jgi:hypothetical protein
VKYIHLAQDANQWLVGSERGNVSSGSLKGGEILG